ncbi:unnamed protein product [Brassicogethes aeneus]|uniref:Uncharacterized protein n=1 Tax=Brassicogethes aeneus TaxID=1431903 RepID=A0A9P0BA42_BRAAE|nr:unnamed protein product [Brassicogethes aeneus]
MSENPSTKDNAVKVGFSVWASLCLFLCIWLVSGFIRGRRRFSTNLHVIEDGLKKMQEELDFKMRQNSIGYIEDLDVILNKMSPSDLRECLLKEDEKEKIKEDNEEETETLLTKERLNADLPEDKEEELKKIN